MQVSTNRPPLHSDQCKELVPDSVQLWLKQKKRQSLPKKGASTDHRGSVSEHVEMSDVGVQVETDQDEASLNEMALEDEVEATAAALKLTDQSDDSDYDSEYFDSDTD